MASQKQDNWSSEAYQHSASFVPKLATQIVQWLDPQNDDRILDIGCGDGVLSLELVRAMGEEGFLHGIDSSPAMIMAANKAAAANKLQGFTRFDVLNAADVPNVPHYKHDFYNKAFSNAAMHWILAPLTEEKRRTFFEGVKGALKPGGVFAFEMGGLGNCSELLAGILMGVGSRVGLEAAKRANPWFFPDEDWITDMMEKKVGGWKIEKIERVWRPTTADAGGVDGWIRLMAKQFFEIVPEEEREACIRDVVETLEVVCAKPGGGYMFSYVRLRVLARKVE